MSDEITVENGRMMGPWRHGVNAARHVTGSIHDDTTAQKVGMRGGTVAGTVHLDLFAPLAAQVFGNRWFECGTLSMFYTYATIDGEDVRAVVDIPPPGEKNAQVHTHVQTRDGKIVMEGTLSVGAVKEPTHLQSFDLRNSPPQELRILAGMKVGDETEPMDVTATPETLAARLKNIEQDMDLFHGESPWGGPIVPISSIFHLMHVRPDRTFQGVGFFGGTEVRIIDGPVKVGIQYIARNKVICVGASPRTEFFWFDGWLHEKVSGKLVATARHMNRYMKAGSALYADS